MNIIVLKKKRQPRIPFEDLVVLDEVFDLNRVPFILKKSSGIPIAHYTMLDVEDVIKEYLLPEGCNLIREIKNANYSASLKIETYEGKQRKDRTAI